MLKLDGAGKGSRNQFCCRQKWVTGSVQFADSSSPFTPPSRVIIWAGCERAFGWGISSRQINEDWDGQVPGVRRNMTDDQGEWSNHAFDTGTGYPNGIGQNGCLSGQ